MDRVPFRVTMLQYGFPLVYILFLLAYFSFLSVDKLFRLLLVPLPLSNLLPIYFYLSLLPSFLAFPFLELFILDFLRPRFLLSLPPFCTIFGTNLSSLTLLPNLVPVFLQFAALVSYFFFYAVIFLPNSPNSFSSLVNSRLLSLRN